MKFKTSKIFIGGLSKDIDKNELKNYFEQFGEVVDCMIILDKENDDDLYLFKLNMPSSGTNGTADFIEQLADGDNNAGTYYEKNGYKYLVTSNGFMKGNNIAIRLNTDGSTTEISMSRTGESGTNKAKDFTWLPNANFTGLSDGENPDVIGYDRKNGKVVYGYISHTNQGDSGGSESISINVQSQSVSTPSNWSSSGDAAGAVFGFGKDELYAINNGTGQLYKINHNGNNSFSVDRATYSSSYLYANNTTNNDGAGCHEGSPTLDWDVAFDKAQSSSCSGSERVVDITLDNSSSGIAATFVVTYSSTDGHSGTITASGGTTVSGGATNDTLSTSDSFTNGATVTLSWYAENTDYGVRTPS